MLGEQGVSAEKGGRKSDGRRVFRHIRWIIDPILPRLRRRAWSPSSTSVLMSLRMAAKSRLPVPSQSYIASAAAVWYMVPIFQRILQEHSFCRNAIQARSALATAATALSGSDSSP